MKMIILNHDNRVGLIVDTHGPRSLGAGCAYQTEPPPHKRTQGHTYQTEASFQYAKYYKITQLI